MNPCYDCKRPADVKCCHNCRKDAAICRESHQCGKDCRGWQLLTRADKIRAMTDAELAEAILNCAGAIDEIPFCKNTKECEDTLDSGKDIPDSKCLACMVDWLQQPADME